MLVAAAGLGLASQLEIPFEPVPVTLQSLAVVLVGFLLGPIGGFAAVALWLVAGATGLPLFAGGEGGIDHLSGPTAGYLFAFPFAAALAGYWGEPKATLLRLGAAALAAHVLILALGAAWLSTKIGAEAALDRGVLPFLVGSLVKSVVAVATAKAIRRR